MEKAGAAGVGRTRPGRSWKAFYSKVTGEAAEGIHTLSDTIRFESYFNTKRRMNYIVEEADAGDQIRRQARSPGERPWGLDEGLAAEMERRLWKQNQQVWFLIGWRWSVKEE